MSFLHRNVARYFVLYGVSKRITATWLRDVRLSMVGCTLSPLLRLMLGTDATYLTPTSRSHSSAPSSLECLLKILLKRGITSSCVRVSFVTFCVNLVLLLCGEFTVIYCLLRLVLSENGDIGNFPEFVAWFVVP